MVTFSISVLKSEGGIYTSTCKSKYIDQSIPRNHIGAITYNRFFTFLMSFSLPLYSVLSATRR